MSRVTVPYSDCDARHGYQQSSCYKDCLVQLIVDRCGCTPFWTLHSNGI